MNQMTREDLPLYHVVLGRALRVVAEFPDTEEGTRLANAYMAENPDIGVLEVINGRVLLADNNDKGVLGVDPAQHMTCCCCGAGTRGRQWWNRDTGYGLCVGCIDFCMRNATPKSFGSHYGVRGIHFDLP